MTTRLQADADRRSAAIRRSIADDLRRFREDAGLSRTTVAHDAGLHRSVLARIEDGDVRPTLETYVRVAAALGADFAARPYPNTGPRTRDRHQVRMSELVLASRHPRWDAAPEVGVRRPARGWIDLVLRDPAEATLLATELESMLRRIEQLLRWSREKAESLPSASAWSDWSRPGQPQVERLLIVRWTRSNRDAASDARRQLREAYPADPRDALEALTGTVAWPGSALLWARIDRGRSELIALP